jgi:hypothetical protein
VFVLGVLTEHDMGQSQHAAMLLFWGTLFSVIMW